MSPSALKLPSDTFTTFSLRMRTILKVQYHKCKATSFLRLNKLENTLLNVNEDKITASFHDGAPLTSMWENSLSETH